MSALPQPTICLPSTNLTSPTTTKTLLKTLSSSPSLTHLKEIHAQILRSNHSHSHSLILKLLLSSPSLNYSLSIFNHLPHPLPSLSNPFLRHLSRSSRPELAFFVYQRLRNEGLRIDRFSFPPLLKAAARVEGFAEGKEIHGFGFKLGFESDPFVQTGTMGMYLACGRVLEARLVFDKMSYRDVVAWSIMIDGYCHNGLFDDALELFEEMKAANIEADKFILSSILSACGRMGNLNYGKAIHDYIIAKKLVVDSYL